MRGIFMFPPEEGVPTWLTGAIDTMATRLGEPAVAESAAAVTAQLANAIRNGTLKHLAPLNDKITAVRERIFAEGAEPARLKLLFVLAAGEDPAAMEILARMLVDGKVPVSSQVEAIGTLRIAIAPEYYRVWLLSLIPNPETSQRMRGVAISRLSVPETLSGLVQNCAAVLKSKKTLLKGMSFNGVAYALREDRRIPEATVIAARDLGWEMLNDADGDIRREGAALYSSALTEDAVAAMGGLLLDENFPVELRNVLASNLRLDKRLEPLFKKLLENYEKLPRTVRVGAGRAAARTPCAAASLFLARWLKDAKADKFDRMSTLAMVSTVKTDELVAAVMALRADPEFRNHADQLLKDWKLPVPSDSPAAPLPPPSGEF